jgi:hypothetical protein
LNPIFVMRMAKMPMDEGIKKELPDQKIR